MFKLVAIVLALSATLVAAQQKLFISNDLYQVENIGSSSLISSKKITDKQISFLQYNKSQVTIQDDYCMWHDTALEQFNDKYLLDSTIEAMNKAKAKDTKRLIEATVDVRDIKIDRLVNYPEPKNFEAKGYKIKVMGDDHCFVTGGNLTLYSTDALILNPYSAVMLFTNRQPVLSGRGCLEPKFQEDVIDEIQEIASMCAEINFPSLVRRG